MLNIHVAQIADVDYSGGLQMLYRHQNVDVEQHQIVDVDTSLDSDAKTASDC